MYSTIILPNYRKLNQYYPNLTEAKIIEIEDRGGDESYLEYQTEASYNRIYEELALALEKYNILEHHTEILFLLMMKNEQIRIRYDALKQNYNDDLTSKEVAQFLLTYKETKPKVHFSIVAKSAINGTKAIKDSSIAKWMAQKIVEAIETRDFPMDLFGEKLVHDLFGDKAKLDTPLDLERLKATANRSPRAPTVRLKKLLVELCSFIQPYLDKHTSLKRPIGVSLTDAQANLFYNLLDILGYLDGKKPDSEGKDYIHATFKNARR